MCTLKIVAPTFVALATVAAGVSCSSEGTDNAARPEAPRQVLEAAKKPKPVLDKKNHVKPKTDRFVCEEENVFWVHGDDLDAVTLYEVTGSLGTPKQDVTWENAHISGKRDKKKLEITGTPRRPTAPVDTKGAGAPASRIVPSDPGDVTVTVSNGGQQVKKSFPANYDH